MMDVLKIEEPKSFEEAQHDPQWKEAIQVDFVSIIKNDTWDLVDRPQKCKVIGTKWVYRVKYKSNGVLNKCKARLVEKVLQMDVKLTFFIGFLNEEVYVEQPPRFLVPGYENKVFRLKKALYELKQAPQAWYERIKIYFLKIGLKRSIVESNLYSFVEGSFNVPIVFYFDDLILTRNHQSKISKIKDLLNQEFEMIDLGLMHYCLGMEVVWR
ncbi:hypothetical protein L7F22_041760 [Adiantum nelumboides]|nr:hypothetical protein [Adiantum nelumboides]